jgi:hypothetical protein
MDQQRKHSPNLSQRPSLMPDAQEILEDPMSPEDVAALIMHRRGHCPTSDESFRGITPLDLMVS